MQRLIYLLIVLTLMVSIITCQNCLAAQQQSFAEAINNLTNNNYNFVLEGKADAYNYGLAKPYIAGRDTKDEPPK